MKKIYLFALAGGILGLTFHLIWHYKLGVQLLSFGPHVLTGTLYTLVGIIIGALIGIFLNKN